MSETYQPTFLIQIEHQELSKDITQEITSFVFTDNEEELDVLELTVTNRNLQFVDDPLFQEGNVIIARFGYVDHLSPRKKVVIKDIDYDFAESGEPTMRIKAYDQGFKLAGKVNQKVWQKPAPGILYSEIAQEIAKDNGLEAVVTPTVTRHLRVVQSNISDAQFLKDLAAKSRDREQDGVSGYVFYVQDDQLHFHPPKLEEAPMITLTYYTNEKGLLRSFHPNTQTQAAKGPGLETKSIGVDPRKKEVIEYSANNATTPDRPVLGKKTYLVDGNTGELSFKEQESGLIIPNYERSETLHEEPSDQSINNEAQAKFCQAEMRQVEADASTLGIPWLCAKKNIEIQGVGKKFSGIYYCYCVRHMIGLQGYLCELKLKKNALGKTGDKALKTNGKVNVLESQQNTTRAMVNINADTGVISQGEKHG